jgi:Uma2 family endonuclease
MIQKATQRRQFGPADHGRRMTYEEFMAGDYQEGYKYELIDGELYVSPEANPDHMWDEIHLLYRLNDYARDYPEHINYVVNKARVFVPGREDVTAPEPDIAAYRIYPLRRPRRREGWERVNPRLVVEIVSPDNADKDLVRNVELYWLVPSIKEYWVIDQREEAGCPLTVYRRQGKKWRIIHVAAGESYTTPLLPGFELVIDPAQ